MASKDKAAKELVELSADQAGHAAKNLAAAGEKVVEEILPKASSSSEGLGFAFWVGPKTVVAATAGLSAYAGVKVGKRVWEYKKARDAKKALKEDLTAKPKIVREPPAA
jgi:hypothetical protein